MNYRFRFFFISCLQLLMSVQLCAQYDQNIDVLKSLEAYKASIKEDSNNRMVDLKSFIPGLALDIRYATNNNFTGKVIYTQPKAFARLPVAKALKAVQTVLAREGLGLKVFDAYRPYAATVMFYEVVKDTTYVASPWNGSRHNRGAAVDLTLIDLKTGKALPMPTEFDDFSTKAHPDHMDMDDSLIRNRQLLMDVMYAHGFTVYPYEWWHYDYKNWESYTLMDISFEALEKSLEKNTKK